MASLSFLLDIRSASKADSETHEHKCSVTKERSDQTTDTVGAIASIRNRDASHRLGTIRTTRIRGEIDCIVISGKWL